MKPHMKPPQSTLSKRAQRHTPTTTAPNRGIPCRCGRGLYRLLGYRFQILFGTPDYIEYLVLGSTSLSRCFLVTTDIPNTQDVVNSIAFNAARLGTEMACFRLMLNFDIFLTNLSSIDYISTKKHRENKELWLSAKIPPGRKNLSKLTFTVDLFCTPSEGVENVHHRYRQWRAIFAEDLPCTPSEGVAFSRLFPYSFWRSWGRSSSIRIHGELP